MNLLPAQPILTASTSADGNEVLAVCTVNPEVPDGPVNLLRATSGNAKFASVGVEPGDIIRYYVQLDEESAELEIERRTALELRVRRLDVRDPENALIIEGGLTGPSPVPQRLEIWRYSDKRMDAIRSSLDRYEKLRRPPLGWEPTPDLGALQQIVERANEWLRNQPVADRRWATTALVNELPSELRLAPGVREAIALENLRDGLFELWEGRFLEEAVWRRDVAQWARGRAASPAEVAAQLFDWTVRNVQLDSADRPATTVHQPWQALAYGHGTAALRAWTFVELCRSQGIDAIVLRSATADDPARKPLLVATRVEDDWLVFEPRLGLQLLNAENQPATLAQLAADGDLIRQFDAPDGAAYPLDSSATGSWEALVVASPVQLARRSRLLQEALQGEDFVALAVDVDALAERLKQVPQIAKVALWEQPFSALAVQYAIKISLRRQCVEEFAPFAEMPLLWKARMVHFQGDKQVRAAERDDPLAQPRRGHADALRYYQHPTVRPGDAAIAKQEQAKQPVAAASKAAASYWLGLLSYDRGNYDVAADWLGVRTPAADEDGRWADGTRYNLARTQQAAGRLDEAAKTLEATPAPSPCRDGNLLLARRLREMLERERAEQSDGADEKP
jgi:hypothetical protein